MALTINKMSLPADTDVQFKQDAQLSQRDRAAGSAGVRPPICLWPNVAAKL